MPKAESTARIAGRRLASGLVATAILGSATVFTQSPDRSKPPLPGPPPAFRTPPVAERTLANGLRVWVVEMHEVPVVDLTMIVRAGASSDPAGRYGLANFTAAMLDEGAGGRSALEFSDAVDQLGATLTTGSTYDASNVRLHVVAAKIDAGLPLLADAVLRPAFPSEEIERLRKERLTTLLQARDTPATLASYALSRLVYGESTRYGTPLIGSETANREIAQADLRAFYTSHYQPQNACLLVVGDVTAAAIVPKIEAAFGSWARGAATPPPVPAAAPASSARRVYLLDKPGAAQSEIRIGSVGVERTTPDYYTLQVLNTILGGSFTSRLNMNLREEHKYTYGASSRFDMRRGRGPFVAGAAVETDKTVDSLREFFKELDGIRAPVQPAELTRARNLEALGFPGEFGTTRDMAAKLAELVIFDLPQTTFSDYVPKIQAVTAADLTRAAARDIRPDAMTVVVVGDLAKIEQPIRAANFGAVAVLKADDVLK